jgi:membrane-associated protein
VIAELIGFFTSLDSQLTTLAQNSPYLFFGVVALIIFVEAGVVLWPFLPGDSMLFVAGAVVALAGLNVHALVALLIAMAIIGNSVNYAAGRYFGTRAFASPDSRIFKPAYLKQTRDFYDKYGPMSIILGRFVPIVRTFVPFLAGVAPMRYSTFLINNIVGGILWIASLVYTGYWFGNVPWVKKNLSLIIVGILVVSVLPIAIKVLQERRKKPV